MHSDAQRMRGRDRNLTCLLLFIVCIWRLLHFDVSRVFPCIVHLDVFVCLTFVHERFTLITQNHLRGLYLGKHSTSVQ